MKTNYSFVKTPEEMDYLKNAEAKSNFFGQEKIQAFWTIDDKLYRKLLPPGFELTAPIAFAYVANFARPEFLYPYSEGALFLSCAVNGEPGAYCLAMPLDNSDQALGRRTPVFRLPEEICNSQA